MNLYREKNFEFRPLIQEFSLRNQLLINLTVFFVDVCGFLVIIIENKADDEHGIYGREITILLEENEVFSCGLVTFVPL